jgi:hypothetical protein
MWLATQHGFYSIVQKPAGQFHVRARCKQDLENLTSLVGIESRPHNTTDGDYAWRIVVGQKEVARIMAALATTIDCLTSVLSGRMTPELAADQAEAAIEAFWDKGNNPEDEDGKADGGE